MTIIYWKCLCVSSAECSNFSEGEIQTFMSIDAERTVNLFNSLHDVWSLPLQIGLALYLLYTQVKFAFISGITLTILLIPVNKRLSTLIAKATKEMMKQKDERIRRTGDLLTNIRTLKMYAWELLFADRLKETRASEVKFLSTRKYLDAWCVFFWATTPALFSLFTFGLFTLTGHTLNAATVFTCLALFNTLISPLNSFPWVINGLIDATISIRRLSTFLSCPEHNSERLQTDDLSAFSPSAASNKQMAVVVRDVSSVWSSSNMEQGSVLHHINLDLPKGFLIAVIGEVGSGKSSLLNAVLGEMRLIQGSIYSHGSIAYVPQVSWIISGTVRDNIILQKNYDAERYIEVLKACSLDVDISLMVGGDLAFIGEKGINLSGGQKARLALARAIYAGADVFLLDDVLSAVDAQVAYWILCKAIKGPLMKQQTRILCTHNPQAIASADMVVIMDRGHVKWTGLSAEFLTTPYATNLLLEESRRSSSCLMKEESGNNVSAEFLEISYLERVDLDKPEEARVLETETRKEGQVDLSVYKNYAKFSSRPTIIVICLSAILMQASRNGNDLWLSFWVDTTAENKKIGSSISVSFYLMVLCIFCAINSVLTLVKAFSFAFAGLRAAVQVHSELLNKLISAPVQFFDQTPTGRILNRFSSDLYTIDDALPFILNILLANFVGLVGLFVVLSYVQVMFLILLLLFWYIYSKLQLYYRSTSRELRRLDSVSRSPIYASFTETLDGSSTIRAFKAKILAAFVISFVASMAVIGSHGWFPVNFSSPGLVGLALSYAAPFVSLLSSYLASFTETEKEMVSVERLVQYMDVPQEEDIQTKGFHISNWPDQGQIDFHHVTLRYMPHLPPALRDLSFTVEGGTQVGIIGRTGAGKSSVLNALFRLTPLCAGHIIVDKVNVADVSLRELRSRIAVVPQSPFVFQGSVRDNVDPYGKKNDAIIWDVLEKCHVKELVQQGGQQLESLIKEEGGGISFSVGQRQLLCLARALLNSSKVLCLDECTANVDSETACLLQDAIGSGGSMTVITIAHRISTVMDMDKILILDHGNLVEQGNPRDLVQDQSSIFSAFARASLL